MRKIACLVILVLLISGCATGQVLEENTMTVKAGDKVKVDYVGFFDGGEVFDTSIKEEAEKAGMPLRPSYAPIEFEVGAGQMIAGFDKAVVGMAEGEEKEIKLAPEDAYGNPKPEMVIEIPTPDMVKMGVQPKVGLTVYANGQPGKIISTDEGKTRIDMNHPMAGKTLNFRLKLVEIEKR